MGNSKNSGNHSTHGLIYRPDGTELSIDRIIRTHDTVWGEVRVAQHSETVGPNACWHIYIDAENNALEYLGNPLEGVGETKEINGQMYTRASFQDRVWRYYDKDFNPLPIKQGIEEFDSDVVEVKDIDGVMYALRRRDDRIILENGTQSASSLMKGYVDCKPEIMDPIQVGDSWYVGVKYRQSGGNYDRTDFDILVLDEKLNKVGEYPIWRIAADEIEIAIKRRLDELIPATV